MSKLIHVDVVNNHAESSDCLYTQQMPRPPDYTFQRSAFPHYVPNGGYNKPEHLQHRRSEFTLFSILYSLLWSLCWKWMLC